MSGLPPSYLVYRAMWSVLHLALLALVGYVVVRWWVHDSHGSQLVSTWASWAGGVQQWLFHLIPFPWEKL